MDIEVIKNKNSKLWNEPYSFFLDKRIAHENLSIVTNFLNEENLHYTIFFGTLLGVIRESDFIDHDKDIDIALLDFSSHEKKQIKIFLKSKGFYIFTDTAINISAVRKGVYIDFYLFEKVLDNYVNEYFFFAEKYFKKIKQIRMQNYKINIPNYSEEILETLYGSNWKTPIQNFHADGSTEEANLLYSSNLFLNLKRLANFLRDKNVFFSSKIIQFFNPRIKKIIKYFSKTRE